MGDNISINELILDYKLSWGSKLVMTLSIKTLMSVLKVLTFMNTVRPVGLSEIPAITSVSTFISAVILYVHCIYTDIQIHSFKHRYYDRSSDKGDHMIYIPGFKFTKVKNYLHDSKISLRGEPPRPP